MSPIGAILIGFDHIYAFVKSWECCKKGLTLSSKVLFDLMFPRTCIGSSVCSSTQLQLCVFFKIPLLVTDDTPCQPEL